MIMGIFFLNKKNILGLKTNALCGVSELKFNRDDSLETYGYPFIHDDPNSFLI